MISRVARVQLIALAIITVVAVGYTGFTYAGFERFLGGATYPVQLRLTDSGGIFTGADVTYRGVSVGRVGPLSLTEQGVAVQLDINDGAPPIPADVRAEVHNLSAIGEQYVDLQPQRNGGPFLEGGSVIPASRATTPVDTEDLVRNLDRFARSVPLDSLATVVEELGTAFRGTGPELQTLLDTSDAFTRDAVEALPEIRALIDDGRTVLETQNDQASAITSFSQDLRLLAEQFERSDPDLRRLIDTAPRFSVQLSKLLAESGSQISALVADLLTVSRIAEPRQDGLRQLLVTYPAVTAAGYTTVPGDGTAHLGLVINNFDPFACTRGYNPPEKRSGNATSSLSPPAPALNEDAHCIPTPAAPNVRGSHNVPRAGVPQPPAVTSGEGSSAPAPQAPPVVAGVDGLAGVLRR
ncbi:MAG: MCE family protein [Pseudonocardiaceae bacterium]|nr:MCE family protein [Pseudonocardiaceae bacterium]